MTKPPFRIPPADELDAMRSPELRELDALRDAKVAEAVAALRAGRAIAFTLDGRVLSRLHPDGRVETFA